MKHFLCTRFNLKNEDWIHTKKGKSVLTKKWLSSRFYLFEKFCVPSVKNQTNKNFKWVIFFDIDTPTKFKKKINGLLAKDNLFIPLYINGIGELETSLSRFILKEISIKSETIITTRLDNDDAIHKDFISTIQKLASGKSEAVIDLIRGLQIDIQKDPFQVRNHFKYYNPFISIVETGDNFKTVLSRHHYEWSDHANIIAYKSDRLWLEVIHDKNMVNEVKNNYYLTNNFYPDDFGLKGINFQNKITTILNNTFLRLKKLKSRFLKT
ncbi:hypothetical protein C7S20_12210 [Christiangramia fulva]|uniref:Rhamnosyl transferase n=1 Tax=Christiangramia fulva TaxID=2126553 RepID=A0A2R3Z6P4_9FLAO|nr:glycosyltransferase [Christiangramia fulva]AVR45956.1 hypothetical protein C7S20_12210 [Christiangramia fulva]